MNGQVELCPVCGKPLSSWLRDCPGCLMRLGTPPFQDSEVEPYPNDETVLATEPKGEESGVGATERLGDYELLEPIAQGGMGAVYTARQLSLKRIVAVKVLLAAEFANETARKRFRREAEAAASLKHPNIVSIYDVGEQNGRPYFSMELIEGRSLAELTRDQPASSQQAALWLKSIAEAVHYAHERGVIHRDLKPSNVLIDAQDVPHVADFGLAKRLEPDADLTLTGQVLGTPSYMPPEQADPKIGETTVASDVYSLGAILYHLLTARPPFMAETLTKTLRLVTEEEPVSPRLLNPGVPLDLETICLKCLEKDPKRRYASARELAHEVSRFLNHEPIQARPASQWYRFQKLVRRNRLAFGAGAAVFAALVIGLGLSTLLFFKERGTRQRAQAAEQDEIRQRQLAEAEGKKARTEAAKSQQVAQFLQDMLQSVGPSVVQGRDTTMLKEILDKTAERVGKDFANQPEVEAELMTTIGSVYHELGQNFKAEDALRKALALRRKLLGAELEVATSLRGLGSVLVDLGKPSEARPLLEEAVAIYRRLPGNEDIEVANCLSELTGVVFQTGTRSEYEEIVRQVLAMQQKILGREHKDVAASLEMVARALATKGDLAQAEETQREALAIYRKALGDRNPVSAYSLDNLADILFHRGKLVEAEAASREALALYGTLMGKDQPGMIWWWIDGLTEALRAEGKLAEAAALVEEQLAKSESDLDERLANQPGRSDLLLYRGSLRARKGRWRDAVADLSKLVELRPDSHTAFQFLAAALLEEGDLEAYHQLCVQIRNRFGDTDSGEIASFASWTCLIAPSPDSMSVSNDSRLADMALKLYKGDWLLISRQNGKALAEYRQGHFSSAAEWASKAMSQPEYCCDRQMVRPDPYKRVQASMLLAMSNYHLGQLDKARVALARGTEIAEAKLEKIESGDIGNYWVYWVYADVLMREAKALIEGSPKTNPSSAFNKEAP